MLLSASNIHRFSLCPSSVLLPRVPMEPSTSSQKGTNIHDFISKCIQYGDEDIARRSMPDRYLGKSVVGRLKFQEVVAGLTDLQTELAVYWKVDEPEEFRLLGSNIGRNYYQAGVEDYNYVGSIDIVAKNSETGNYVIADVKTGLQEIAAVESQQLQLLGYIMSRILNVDTIETRIIKVYDTGLLKISSHVIGPKELKLIEARLRAYHSKVKDNYKEYTKGHATDFFTTAEVCNWCPCKTVCPAYEQWQSTLALEAQTKSIGSFSPIATEPTSPMQSTTNYSQD